MKRLYLVLSFLLLSWILVFAFKKPPSSLPGEENHKAQQDDFPKLTGPCLGQKPPGMTPEIFAPGIVSLGFHEHGMALSPDGKDIFYVAADARFSRYVIMHSQLRAGEWTEPRVASFSGKEIDLSPAFSPDGKRLYFASKRPLTTLAGPKNDFDIWYVERTDDGWSAPLNPGGPVNTEKNEVNPTFMSDGTLVFQALEKLGSLAWDIYIAEWKNGAYAPPEKMLPPVNTDFNESGPFIAPGRQLYSLQLESAAWPGDHVHVRLLPNTRWPLERADEPKGKIGLSRPLRRFRTRRVAERPLSFLQQLQEQRTHRTKISKAF